MVFVLYGLGRMREAADVVRRVFRGRDESAAARFRSRITLGWLTLTAIFTGEFAKARQMIARLEPFARAFSVQTPFVRALELCYGLIYGDFDGLREKLDEIFGLARAGGEITKEALSSAGWGVADYHPLRDDKRMQVALRNLRTLIEDEPSAPRRLLTTEDGYVFGDTEPVRVLRRGS